MISQKSRIVIASLALCGVAVTSVPALAQSDDEARLRKVEAEVRALQRKVFPGGDGRYFEPQIGGQQAPASTPATNTTTALTDVLARLDALEAQLQRLTSQTEENNNEIQLLKTRLDTFENRPVGGLGAAPIANAGNTGDVTVRPSAASPANPVVGTGSPAVTPAPATTASAGPSAARLAAVQAIAKPQTGDEGDDEYSYGFRLWDAGFFPEAQQQLTLFVEKYPNHSRVTYGRNLLGRAYLDDNKPEQAAPWFLRNYQADKQARRAPDSLLYLAEAMIAVNDTDRACIALAEFGDTYPAVAAGRLSNQYEANRRKVSCN